MRPPFLTLSRSAVLVLAVAVFLVAPPVLVAQPPPWPLGPEFRVNTYTTGPQRRPAMAATQGGFVVAWEGASQGDPDGVLAQQYNGFGAPIGLEFRVNTYTTSAQHSPSVASKRGSNLIFAWQSEGQDGDAGGIVGRRFGTNGLPLGGEFQVNSYTTSIQSAPSIASDSAGNFLVVWASLGQDGSDYGVFGQRFASSGAPLGGEFRVNTYTTGFQGHPAAGMDPNGYFIVVWEGEGADDQPFGIFAQRYLNTGTPLGGEFRVNSYTPGNQRYPSVDNDFGRFVVVWQSDGQDGSGYGIFAKKFIFGSGSSYPEFRVNTFTTGAQAHPKVATTGVLDCAITWESGDAQDPQGGIFAMFYYGCSIPSSMEYHVNTQTAGIQNGPAVAIWADFPVIAWTSEQDPDGSPGVYGQRFEPGWLPVELQDFTIE